MPFILQLGVESPESCHILRHLLPTVSGTAIILPPHNCHLSPVDLKVDLLGKVIVQLVVGLQPGLQGLPSRVSDVGHLAGLTGVLLQISTEEQYYESK